jgi:hypothetical protein
VKRNELLSDTWPVLAEKLIELRKEVIALSDYMRRPVTRVDGSVLGFSIWRANFDLLQQGLNLVAWLDMCDRLIGQCFQRALVTKRDMALIEDRLMKTLLPPIPRCASSVRHQCAVHPRDWCIGLPA